MKKYLNLFFGTVLSVTMTVNAQEISNFGSASFLDITPDARSAAMGGVGVAMPGNNYSFFHNGATSLSEENSVGGVSYTFTPWLREIESGYSLNSMGGFYKIDENRSIFAGFRYFNYPKIEMLDNMGNPEGSLRPNEWAIDVGYARRIFGNFALSLTGRYIHSDMGSFEGGKNAGAAAFDLGAVYINELRAIEGGRWSAGLRIGNVGTKLKYDNTKESLPAVAKLGGSVFLPFSYTHRLSLAADLGYRLAPSDAEGFNFSAGAEYGIVGNYFLRGGYHYGNKDNGDESYWTAGAGINFYGIHADFTYLIAESASPLKNTFWISLGFSF